MTADILGTTVGFSHHSSKGVDWVFVEHGSYDRPGGLYGDESGVYGDNQVRFLPRAMCHNSLKIVLNDCMRGQLNATMPTRPVAIQLLCGSVISRWETDCVNIEHDSCNVLTSETCVLRA